MHHLLEGTLYVKIVPTTLPIPVDAPANRKHLSHLDGPPIKGPDGMRAANGKLIVQENGSGKFPRSRKWTRQVSLIKEGLNTPPSRACGRSSGLPRRGAASGVGANPNSLRNIANLARAAGGVAKRYSVTAKAE